MIKNRFAISSIPNVNFSITHSVIDRYSSDNTPESHMHIENEIYLNLCGDVSFEVENNIYPLSRGSVIITRPYEYHHCIYHSDALHDHYAINFSGDESIDFLKIFYDRKPGTDNLIVLSGKQLNECLMILEELENDETDSLSCRIGFLKLLQLLNQGEEGIYVDSFSKLPQDVSLALQFMNQHLTEDLNIEFISTFCNVSVNTLERHFKKTLGMTPFAWLRKKRLIASLDYLRNGESVTDAALKSGFSDYSNYIQLFRRQFGITPLKYRQKFENE